MLRKAKEEHDEIFWKFDSENIGIHPQIINHTPYLLGDGTTKQEERIAINTAHYNSRFENLAHNFTHAVPMRNVNTKKLFFFLRKRSQLLCQNKVLAG